MNALALVAFLSVAVPSDQQVVDEINLLRADPRHYASFLEARLQLYRGNVLRLPGQVPLDTKEGKVAVQEAIRVLRQTVSVPALRPASGLSRAARDHVKDIGPKGLVQHKGSDKSDPADRVRRYAAGETAIGEVISFGPDQARDVVLDLLIDDGVPSRGHRKILLDSRFRYIGSACGSHALFRTMCVIDLAAGYGSR
jgi:uncharacterized protein YkwD